MIGKISASLLNSLQWYLTCPKSWKVDARVALIDQLNRVKSPHTSATSRGTLFEKALNKCADAENEDIFWNEVSDFFAVHNMMVGDATEKVVRKFYPYCYRAEQQVPLSKILTIDDMDYSLFGIADLVVRTRGKRAIYDIKTTVNYKPNKYTESSQHLLYMLASGIEDFTYIVAEYDDICPVDFHEVHIHMPLDKVEMRLTSLIREFVAWAKGACLWDKYLYIYSKNVKRD